MTTWTLQSLLASWPALRSRNFRLYIGGQTISLAGTFMQQVAMSWLVYRLTHSAFALGAVSFATEMCGVAVVLLGGLLVDRHDPARIVLVTQSLAMVQAAVLAALVLSGGENLAAIVVLSCMLGFVNGVDVPARQVFVARLVERRVLGNAIVLTSLALDSARLVGPSIGGALVAAVGEWLPFLLNALSYVAIIAALLAMNLPPQPRTASAETVGKTLASGFAYAWDSRFIKRALLLVALISFAGSPYMVLMPLMAAEVLGGGPNIFGLLMASSGVGALAGAMYLGSRRTASGYDRLCGLGAGIFGASVFLFAISRSLFISIPLLIIAGFGIMMLMACTHTLLLMLADEDKRGRVMSLFTLSFMATVPFGNLLAGSVASAVGAPLTIALGSGACVIGALLYWRSLGEAVRDRRAFPRS